MGTTTANMSLQKPTLTGDPGTGDPGTWDDQINASLDIIDGHTHGPGSGVQLGADGLNIVTDLSLHGTAALIASKAISFQTQASYTTIRSLWVKTSDGELYWRNGSGTDVKMTSGGTLNIAIVGGIVGDYASASAAVYYDDAAQAYRFLEAAPLPNSWSRVQCGDLDLYQHASGIANRVRLSSPAALAASYDLTLPGALPGSTSILQVSATGAITASNTIANAVVLSSSLAVGTTLTVGTTLGVTGLITATAGVTCAANTDVTVSGTGRHKHGTQFRTVAAADFIGNSMSFSGGAAGGYTVSTAGTTCFIPIAFVEGETINLCTIDYYGDGAADITSFLVYQVTAAGTVTVVSDVGFTATNPSAAWVTSSDIVTATITPPAGASLWAEVVVNAANIRLKNLRTGYSF